jgi:hypothetical protein
MGLVSKRMMPDSRGLVDRRARFVKSAILTLVARLTACCTCSFQIMNEDYPQELGDRKWLDGIAIMISWAWLCALLSSSR